jgi:hypothetical protein
MKHHAEMFAGRWMYFDSDFCGWGATWRLAYRDWLDQVHTAILIQLQREAHEAKKA